MKKLNLLFLSVLALGIAVTSCGKEVETPAKESILGKWEFGTMEGTYGGQAVPAGTKEAIWCDIKCTEGTSYFEFTDGITLLYGSYYSFNNCEFGGLGIVYSVNSTNTVLTLFDDTYPILKLTDKELHWREQSSADGVEFDIVHKMLRR